MRKDRHTVRVTGTSDSEGTAPDELVFCCVLCNRQRRPRSLVDLAQPLRYEMDRNDNQRATFRNNPCIRVPRDRTLPCSTTLQPSSAFGGTFFEHGLRGRCLIIQRLEYIWFLSAVPARAAGHITDPSRVRLAQANRRPFPKFRFGGKVRKRQNVELHNEPRRDLHASRLAALGRNDLRGVIL